MQLQGRARPGLRASRRPRLASVALAQPAAASTANDEQAQVYSERGAQFITGSAFYRAESAQGRDLAVLAAALHKARTGRLRVLDVMGASGVRGVRYFTQAGADEVWTNDFNPSLGTYLAGNLCPAAGLEAPAGADAAAAWQAQARTVAVPGLKRTVTQWDHPRPRGEAAGQAEQERRDSGHLASASSAASPAPGAGQGEGEGQGGGFRLRISHVDAYRLVCACALAEDHYDLVDIDSFGSEARFMAAAIDTVRYGGLLYLTSTDGFCSGGHRPERSLASYGAYARALPWSNEQGLRMLIGAAVREGASRGVVLTPVFSLFSYHGPVFRVMLRARSSAEWEHQHYGFLGHCHVHGETARVPWTHLSSATCRWTGPLHCLDDLLEMQEEARRRGWVGYGAEALGPAPTPGAGPGAAAASGSSGSSSSSSSSGNGSRPLLAASQTTKKNRPLPLEQLLEVLVEEAQAGLRPGYVTLDDVGRHTASYPPRDKLIAQLRERGFAAARCHIDSRALRTGARMREVVAACRDGLGIPLRPGSPFAEASAVAGGA